MQPDRFGRVDDIAVFDEGGDNATFHGITEEGRSLGREVKPVFSHSALDGYYFDPFQCSDEIAGEVITKACQMMEGLSISKTRRYGEQYFWFCNMEGTIAAIKGVRQSGKPCTIRTIYDHMDAHPSKFKDAAQVKYALGLLCLYPQICTPDDGRGKFIRWRDMERENYIPYFYLPGLNQPTATYRLSDNYFP
jgi:hypothetical protein